VKEQGLKTSRSVTMLKTKENGLIHGWGSEKRKKDYRTFMGLFVANNVYLKQI
jgi:hypothetical protein